MTLFHLYQNPLRWLWKNKYRSIYRRWSTRQKAVITTTITITAMVVMTTTIIVMVMLTPDIWMLMVLDKGGPCDLLLFLIFFYWESRAAWLGWDYILTVWLFFFLMVESGYKTCREDAAMYLDNFLFLSKNLFLKSSKSNIWLNGVCLSM